VYFSSKSSRDHRIVMKVLVIHIMIFDIKYVVLFICMQLFSYWGVSQLKKNSSRCSYTASYFYPT